MTQASLSKRGVFTAKVRKNVAAGTGFYRLSLDLDVTGSAAFSQVCPGQFAELDLCKVSLPASENIPDDLIDVTVRQIILRRPFSFCDVNITEESDASGVCIDILYCVIGPGTLRMTTLSEGDLISVIGPLGNGFSVPDGKQYALLVAGGMGVPPLLHLAKVLSEEHPDINVIAIIGAKTVKELPISQDDFARYTQIQLMATDDGSAGLKGFVTVHLDEWLGKHRDLIGQTVIYSCGPEPMLAEAARLAGEYDVDCQVSLERLMACGIGICQSCAVETLSIDKTETVYKLCCKDGPVFNSRDVVF